MSTLQLDSQRILSALLKAQQQKAKQPHTGDDAQEATNGHDLIVQKNEDHAMRDGRVNMCNGCEQTVV